MVPAVAVAVNTAPVLLILIVSPAVPISWVSDETVAATVVPLFVGVRLPSVVSTNKAEPSAAVMLPALSILTSVDWPPSVTVAERLWPAGAFSESVRAVPVRPVSARV
ncbi:hypothetical protein D9M72_638170 [compost metagenome]